MKNEFMRKIVLVLILSLTLLSCNDEAEQKTLDLGRFTVKVPSPWTLDEVQGYDSFVTQIKINEEEKISVDLGFYSSNLNVDNSTHDVITRIIDSKEAKVVKPKNFKRGTTGVYFDSLDIQKTKLQISGVDLSHNNQLLFLNVIETLKFK